MGKRIKLRRLELGEVGRFGSAIITGANLRKPPKERPKEPKPAKEEPEQGERGGEKP